MQGLEAKPERAGELVIKKYLVMYHLLSLPPRQFMVLGGLVCLFVFAVVETMSRNVRAHRRWLEFQ